MGDKIEALPTSETECSSYDINIVNNLFSGGSDSENSQTNQNVKHSGEKHKKVEENEERNYRYQIGVIVLVTIAMCSILNYFVMKNKPVNNNYYIIISNVILFFVLFYYFDRSYNCKVQTIALRV